MLGENVLSKILCLITSDNIEIVRCTDNFYIEYNRKIPIQKYLYNAFKA